MNATLVQGLKWKPPTERVLRGMVESLNQYIEGLPEAQRAIAEDAREAGQVVKMAPDRRVRSRVRQERLVMQPGLEVDTSTAAQIAWRVGGDVDREWDAYYAAESRSFETDDDDEE